MDEDELRLRLEEMCSLLQLAAQGLNDASRRLDILHAYMIRQFDRLDERLDHMIACLRQVGQASSTGPV